MSIKPNPDGKFSLLFKYKFKNFQLLLIELELLIIRANNDVERVSAMENYIKRFCEEKSQGAAGHQSNI